MHRHLLFAAAVAAATAASAPEVLAADLPIKAVSDQVAAPLWSGYYFGVHGGWGWGKMDANTAGFNPPLDSVEALINGPIAGGQLGWNAQYGNLVLGGELDGSWSFVRGNLATNQSIITSSANDGVNYRAFATATGRIGYASDRWLAYAKGGLAYVNMELTTQFTPTITTYDRNLLGGVVGAGLEVAFLRNVSAKVEYNYLFFPTDQLLYAFPTTTSTLSHSAQLVKVGINVRFAGDGNLAR